MTDCSQSFCTWSPQVSQQHRDDPNAQDYMPDAEEEWSYDKLDVYAWPDAGWLHRDESIANLREALAAWKARVT